MAYNPVPPRAWSRVENPCVYIVPGSNYTSAFIPLTGQTVSQAQADYEMKQFYKGNILQYKGNSARFTKSQKYSQIARGCGPSRTKVFATQSQTYTNPNTTGLLRVGYNTYPFPNQIVGAPNNISGPFQYNVPNPNDCSGNSVQDGGVLVCGSYANPCTGEIYKTATSVATVCNPSSASDVPGPGFLCWNYKIQTWFPKPRYFNNNSTNKWPVNYKGLVSAVRPQPPNVVLVNCNTSFIEISWTPNPNNCLPISSYKIYLNEDLYATVPYTVLNYVLNESSTQSNSICVTALSTSIESAPSNIVNCS